MNKKKPVSVDEALEALYRAADKEDATCPGVQKATTMRCTRGAGHKGPHIANGTTTILALWRD
jgi:hypothetical protein